MAWTRSGSPRGSYRAAFATFRNDRRTLLLLLLFLLTTPAFAITIQSLDIDNVDDTDIESDLDVRVTKEGSQPVTHRIRPARLFVMYNGGFGMGDEVQAALAKIVVMGAQQTLARLNREHFQAPALPAMERGSRR